MLYSKVVANAPHADQNIKQANRADMSLHRLQKFVPAQNYSIGGAGTVNVFFMGDDGEVEGSTQTLTINGETGVQGMPGIVFPLDAVQNVDKTLVNVTYGPPRCSWMEIVALTGLITWGMYGRAKDDSNDGKYLKVGSHLVKTLPLGTSLRIGPYPEDQISENGMEVDIGPRPVLFNHNPGTNTQATATVAAPGAGLRNVLTSVIAKLVGGTSAPTAINLSLNVIGGASAGTPVWSVTISLDATAGRDNGFVLDDVYIPVALNTALTVEFSVAGGTNTFESVSGTVIQVSG